MIVRGYKKGDVQRLSLQNEQIKELGDWSFYDSKYTYVFEEDGEILALIRPEQLPGGRIFVASLISKNIGRKMFGFVKKLKQMLVEEQTIRQTLRIEFVTQVGFPQAEHLAELLGFEYEGTMKKYYNGIDFKLWGKV